MWACRDTHTHGVERKKNPPKQPVSPKKSRTSLKRQNGILFYMLFSRFYFSRSLQLRRMQHLLYFGANSCSSTPLPPSAARFFPPSFCPVIAILYRSTAECICPTPAPSNALAENGTSSGRTTNHEGKCEDTSKKQHGHHKKKVVVEAKMVLPGLLMGGQWGRRIPRGTKGTDI